MNEPPNIREVDCCNVFREFLCFHNPSGYNGVCNDEGSNYCPEGGCDRANLKYVMTLRGKNETTNY